VEKLEKCRKVTIKPVWVVNGHLLRSKNGFPACRGQFREIKGTIMWSFFAVSIFKKTGLFGKLHRLNFNETLKNTPSPSPFSLASKRFE
jgi:hypothetical protein